MAMNGEVEEKAMSCVLFKPENEYTGEEREVTMQHVCVCKRLSLADIRIS
jgi:hypothetical protein